MHKTNVKRISAEVLNRVCAKSRAGGAVLATARTKNIATNHARKCASTPRAIRCHCTQEIVSNVLLGTVGAERLTVPSAAMLSTSRTAP